MNRSLRLRVFAVNKNFRNLFRSFSPTGLTVFLFLAFLSYPVISISREPIPFPVYWKFALGPQEKAYLPGFDDSGWQTVRIPHDWAISGPFFPGGDGNTGKLPWKGEGWYRNTFGIPEKEAGQCIYLVCDGIMSSPEIYINGKLAGGWDYGYNSFYLDITKLARPGVTNHIAIHADTRDHDSRWYPGAGIFRKISLFAVDPLHVGIWGTYITTPYVAGHLAEVRIVTTVLNRSGKAAAEITVEQVILDPSGHELTREKIPGAVPANGSGEFEAVLQVEQPDRWDVFHGSLYSVRTIVSDSAGIITDTCTTPFGIRTIRFTANDGFHLNGRRVQLKGVNLHHDLGPLGAAFNTRAMERQLELLKTMGCNAVRTSHNTAAPELLDLCNRMGILVFDEVFDKYDRKADIGPETDFEEFAARNIRNFVLRDRNHPSVFIWSVGNEMGDIQRNENGGFGKLAAMVSLVKRFDPTRPVTMVCDDRNSAAKRHFDYYDVHCWNYGRRYDLARQMEPSKSVIISESASTVSTRGFYELPLPVKKTDFTASMKVSSYDLNAPEWAEIADDDFMWQQDEPYIAGEFAWTGFDYLGEPTPYTNEWAKSRGLSDSAASHSSYFGIFDLCGIPKDRYYLYRSHWNSGENTIHILPHWNWPGKEGTVIPVFVYTNGDCAELYLNGNSLGKRCKTPGSKISTERFRLMWDDVIYEPGVLSAVAYLDGKAIGEEIVRTAGIPYRLRLTPDRSVIKAGGDDISYILVEAVDEEGNTCPLANDLVGFNITGQGSIAGVGNGDPRSNEPFQDSSIHLFHGKAMLILRSDEKEGAIRVKASGKVMLPGTTVLISE